MYVQKNGKLFWLNLKTMEETPIHVKKPKRVIEVNFKKRMNTVLVVTKYEIEGLSPYVEVFKKVEQ